MITHKNDLTDYVSHNGLQQCLELLRSSQLRQAATELDLLLTNSNSVYIHNKKSCKTHTHTKMHTDGQTHKDAHTRDPHIPVGLLTVTHMLVCMCIGKPFKSD